MRIIKLSIIFLVLISGLTAYGQQDPQYTQYMYNMNILNPAYAGSEGSLNIGILGRTQWTGIEGAPKTLTASINAPIAKRVGLGFSAIVDKIGPVKEQNVYTDFSYTIPVSSTGNLAFGLKGGVTFFNVDLTSIDLGDNKVDNLFKENVNKTMMNFGAGLFYYTNRYYLGLSVPNFLKTTHLDKKYQAVEDVHGFLTGGYIFTMSESLDLKPSFLVKAAPGAPLSIDLSLNALLYHSLELGLSWRHDDSISGLVNVKVTDMIRVGYAYDYTISDLSDYSSGTHELMLLIHISNSRETLSPRFF